MANEAQVRGSLQIRILDDSGRVLLDYRGLPTTFNADVDSIEGPTPGSFLATTAGVDVDLSALTTPGLARFQNNDPTNYVEYGIWDPTGAVFYPLGELLPGESYPIRLSRNIGNETGPGDPGTAVLDNDNRLRFKAISGACQVTVEAFGK
jgi:hypothetical protein